MAGLRILMLTMAGVSAIGWTGALSAQQRRLDERSDIPPFTLTDWSPLSAPQPIALTALQDRDGSDSLKAGPEAFQRPGQDVPSEVFEFKPSPLSPPPPPVDYEFVPPRAPLSRALQGYILPKTDYFNSEIETRFGGGVEGQLGVPFGDFLTAVVGAGYDGVSHGTLWTATFGLMNRADPTSASVLGASQFGFAFDMGQVRGLPLQMSAGGLFTQARMEALVPLTPIAWFRFEANWPTQMDRCLFVEEVLYSDPFVLVILGKPGEIGFSRGARVELILRAADRLTISPYWRHLIDPDRSIVGAAIDLDLAAGRSLCAEFAGSGDTWWMSLGIEFPFGPGPETRPAAMRFLKPLDLAEVGALGMTATGPSDLFDIPK